MDILRARMTYVQDSHALLRHAAEDGAAYRPPPRRRRYNALVLIGFLLLLLLAAAVATLAVAATATSDPALCQPHAGAALPGDLVWRGAEGGACTPRLLAILGRFVGIVLLSFSLGSMLYVGALLILFLRSDGRDPPR